MAKNNNSLDDIIKCNIEISNPTSNDATFDSILLVVDSPSKATSKTTTEAFKITKADDLPEYGFSIDDTAYKAATVAFLQNPSPKSLYVIIRDKQDETYEKLSQTLARASQSVDFYGVYISTTVDNTALTDVSMWVESNEKLLGFEYSNMSQFPIKNTNLFRTFAVYQEDGENPSFTALAMMAKCFGYDPGTETWHMKELSSVSPSSLSSNEKELIEKQNATTFLRYAGSNVTIGGKTLAGEYIDVIRTRDWLKSEIQSQVFGVVKNNRKVPFNDNGIGLIEGAIISVLKRGQAIGAISNTEYDSEDNAIAGYTVSVPNASDLTEVERKSRKLSNCRWSARLTGAIHAVEIKGNLTF